MEKRIKRLLSYSGSIARKGLFLLVAVAMLALPAAVSRASHVDLTPLADADGALDDDVHLDGIHLAMHENWLAALMMMTEQFVTTMMQQLFIFGAFLDAEQQLEVQRLFQELTAEAHKDFHPSFQMCQFGTVVKSLAQAEHTAGENARMLDSMLERPEHLHANLSTAAGTVGDITMRVNRFKRIYCDLDENDREIGPMCNNSEGPLQRRSKDIDFPRLIDLPYTLDVNYFDGLDTETEQDIFALARNLYASPAFDFMPEQLLNETAGQHLFLEARSVHAIRSVARRSFAHIVGQKAEGHQGETYHAGDFLYGIIHELGVPQQEVELFLGENPSYFAQMEVLTRKIYQSPEFFTNLYDKPANVQRIGVSLQAIELMQDRDRYEAALRREMLLSLILELKLRIYQENITSALFATINQKPSTPEIN